MFASNNGTNDPGNSNSNKDYFYALRLEKVVKEGVDKVALNSIFGTFLREMQKHAAHPLMVSDTQGGDVDFTNPIPEEGFKERFAVDIAEGKKQKLVILGFHMTTKTPLSTLKKDMFEYLKSHGIFVRPHAGGFANGVKNTYLGYIGKENPATANTQDIIHKIAQAITNFWSDDQHWTMEDRQKFQREHNNVMTTRGPSIPVVIERATQTAVNGDKKVAAEVLQVTVPSTHAEAAKILVDGAFLKHNAMPEEFVPVGLRRENAQMYYDLLREQAKWLHHHRNVQIQDIAPFEAQALKKQLEDENHPAVHRIYIDSTRNRIHISTNDESFSQVQTWVTRELSKAALDSNPTVVKGKKAAPGSQGKSIYSKMFTARTNKSDGSFDSTIKTARSNAWYKQRAVPLMIDFSAEAEAFPPLPAKGNASKEDIQTTFSKVSLTDDTTIRTAIASATQEIEARYEQRLQELSNSFAAKLSHLEATIRKFEEMDSKLDLLLDRMFAPPSTETYQTVSTPTRKTKRRDTKPTPIIIRHSQSQEKQQTLVTPTYANNQYDALATPDDDSIAMEFEHESQPDEPSATSTTTGEGRKQ